MTMADDDLYALLEVDRSASPDEIKKAYRRLARELHPDANSHPEAEERFKAVSSAYEILSDPAKREQYDRFGTQRPGGSPFDAPGGFGDIFDAFFSQMAPNQGRRSGPTPGADIEATLVLELVEAAFGVAKDITLRLPVPCTTCEAIGAAPGTTPEQCGECGGSGEVRRVRQSLLGQMITASPCPRCQGTGATIPSPCPTCHGDGRITEERTLTVEVPAGVEDGTTLRLTGRGAAGPRGGPSGSLYVQLRVAADERFERNGDDLHTLVHVSVSQAALGTRLSVDTLEEPELVAIEPGTQSGAVLKRKGLGIPHLQARGRGDFYIHVQVDTPAELTEREVELLSELAAIRGEHIEPPEESSGLFSKIKSAFH